MWDCGLLSYDTVLSGRWEHTASIFRGFSEALIPTYNFITHMITVWIFTAMVQSSCYVFQQSQILAKRPPILNSVGFLSLSAAASFHILTIQRYTVWAVSSNLCWCADVRCPVLWLQTHWIAMSLRSVATGQLILRTLTASRYISQPTTTSTACLVCDARTLCEASLLSGLVAGSVRNCPCHFQNARWTVNISWPNKCKISILQLSGICCSRCCRLSSISTNKDLNMSCSEYCT